MTDSMRVSGGKVHSAAGLSPSSAPTSAKAATRIVAPNAPVSGLKAAAAGKPAPLAMEASASSARIANALTSLAAAKPWGEDFSFTHMSEAEAAVATTASLARLNADVHGIASADHGFAPRAAFADDLGFAHVRLDRTYKGVKIFGEQVVSHVKDGKVVDVTSSAAPRDLALDTQPKVSANDAAEIAGRAFGKQRASVPVRELVIVKTDDGYKLAHHVVLKASNAPRTVNYFIDAQNGAVMPESFQESDGFIPEFRMAEQRASSAIAANSPDAPANAEVGSGASIYLGQVKLNTMKDGGKFVLRDPVTKAETRDAKNGDGGASSDDNVILTDNNNVWGEASDDARVKPGIDAQYAAQKMLEYLKDMYNRNSLDDKGLVLLSNVHVRTNFVNAYWDGEAMNYGDGDGKNAGPLVDKDVGSHEPMHGLTQATCGLIYRGESGALNEAASDILGSAGFSWYLRGKGDAIANDFLIGEDCWTPSIKGDALRYMNDPTKDRRAGSELYSRDNYKSRYTGSADNGGVHLNSGIANNFFFLLCQGGTNRSSGMTVENGVGMEKALRIYFRAHTTYFTPSETFAQARDAMLKAAADLYGAGSAEQKVVAQAWSAVGVESRSQDQA